MSPPNDRVPPRHPTRPNGGVPGYNSRVEQPQRDEIEEGATFLVYLLLCVLWIACWIGSSTAIVLMPWSAGVTVLALTVVAGSFGFLTLGTLYAGIRS